MTVVLTTHYMEEADRLCDRIAIVDRGRIVVAGHAGRAEGRDARGRPVTLEDVYLHSTGRTLEVAA